VVRKRIKRKRFKPALRPAPAEAPPGIGHNRPPGPIEDPPLLLTRRQTAAMLNVSASKLIRMEAAGVLHPVKLIPGQSAMTHYRRSNVLEVAERGAAQ
jgi:hypothetical protein